jgi:hypothetical protein
MQFTGEFRSTGSGREPTIPETHARQSTEYVLMLICY